MARDFPVSDDGDSRDNSAENAADGSNSSLLDRRSYLKLAGTATVAATATGAASAAGEEYEVIEADNSNYFLDDGEVFENKIIDFSNGNWFTIIANATNWTIRNVGFRGVHDHDHNAIVARDDSGGTSTIENVYLGDGCVRPSTYSSHGQCGIFVHRDHSGHLDIRNVYTEDWPNNGIYASAAAYDTPGTVTIENCFGKNNYVASLRVSDGGKVIDSVAYNDGNGRYTGRPFWGWGDQEVIGCDLDGGPYAGGDAIFGRSGSNTSVEDTRHTGYNMSGSGGYTEGANVSTSGTPDHSVPDGVPTSPEAAAGGSSNTDVPPQDESSDDTEEPSLANTIVFDGNGTADTTSYEFVVSEAVEASTDEGATIDAAASVDGDRASGTVADYLDAFRFDGQLERLTVDGDATVRVNGVEIDPDDIDDVLQDVVLVDGSPEDVTRYEFTVSGEAERSGYDGASIDDEDVIEDGTVHGVVADWKDAFRYSGEIEEMTLDGPGTVSVNGEQVDPSDFGVDLPHELEVRGPGVPVGFEITVDGTIEFDGDDRPEDEATTISGSTVQSTVTSDTLRFRFSGALTDITMTGGKATVTVDGEEVDLDEYGDPELLRHALVIDGTDASGPSTYSFRVDGKVIKSEYRDASIDDGDVLEDTTVRGGVGGWLDAYWFEGDVEDFTLLGDAAVDIQYNARKQ
ncbi:hypothetical protein [Natrinema salaciae]|uniref:Right handed beta helix region n=1 Tax=Natrinema salaciae TaxID=1186196 RepID=A0A1H9AC20_9EURY|nr:hypothetical protein [Natrinema salaciae]SEP73538.1 hypothetical protein SAMN04489841_0393 [Natrinema salaciae]